MANIYQLEPCAVCIKPESFYHYACGKKYTKERYLKEFPCNHCDIEKIIEEDTAILKQIMGYTEYQLSGGIMSLTAYLERIGAGGK